MGLTPRHPDVGAGERQLMTSSGRDSEPIKDEVGSKVPLPAPRSPVPVTGTRFLRSYPSVRYFPWASPEEKKDIGRGPYTASTTEYRQGSRTEPLLASLL